MKKLKKKSLYKNKSKWYNLQVMKKFNLNKKLDKILKFVLNFLKNKFFHSIILGFSSFFILDIVTRLLGKEIEFLKINSFVPNLFSIVWISLFMLLTLFINKKIGKPLYILFFILSITMFAVNNVYYSLTKNFFDFALLGLAKEGSEFFVSAIKSANIWIYITIIISIALFVISFIKFPWNNKTNYKGLIITIILFIIIHQITPLLLGEKNNELTWNTWKNPRNVYENYNDNNKSLSVSGIFEYTIRNYYKTYLEEKKTTDEKELLFLSNMFKESKLNEKNKYTGIFEGKNIIFLQFEGIDNWLLTKKIMPNTYKLLNNSINFLNHFSYYNGGGSTFNSEFAVNTGFITPISYTKNAYSLNKNDFPNSLAKIFTNLDYRVNAFHMNTGEYYSRNINYKNWGFDKYYGLKDLKTYDNEDYMLDRELINNDFFYENMFKKEGNFINYLITYSVHMPFQKDKGLCQKILNKEYEEKMLNDELTEEEKENLLIEFEEAIYTEEDCINIQAKETDDMVGLLMQALKDNNLYDNTIIVAFSDHYLYTIADKTLLDKKKETSNNLINETPFFIWSSKQKKTNIYKATSQIDILPTVLNLMGIEYDNNNYLGKDALGKEHNGIVFFNDYSWYDGKYYVENGTNDKIKDINYIEESNSYVDYIIKKNDLILKHDYFKNKQ